MKCKIIHCDKEVKDGFECCSALHGANLRFYRAQLRDARTEGDQEVLDLYTKEEIEAYDTTS